MKYLAYSEYKNSGVEWLGDVPREWECGAVWMYFYLGRGRVISNEEITDNQGDYPVYSSQTENNGVMGKLSSFDFEGDYLTWTTDGANAGTVFERHGKFNCTNVCGTMLLKNYHRNNLTFYMYALNVASSWFVRHDINPKLMNNVMSGIRIPILPLSEQTIIANFLDRETTKIDTLISKQQKLISLLQEKRQAVISHAVIKGINPDAKMKDSGVEWLGDVPEHWKISGMKHYVDVIDCKHITAPFTDSGVPLASISEVKGWEVNLRTAKLTTEEYYQLLVEGGRKPTEGDIIYSRNATVGEAALVTTSHPKFAMGQDVCLLRLVDDIIPNFLLYQLNSSSIENQLMVAMVGATFKRINVDDIRNFSISVPPKNEQSAILDFLTYKIPKIDSLITKVNTAIKLLQERRTALISAAVTGKIDVRNA